MSAICSRESIVTLSGRSHGSNVCSRSRASSLNSLKGFFVSARIHTSIVCFSCLFVYRMVLKKLWVATFPYTIPHLSSCIEVFVASTFFGMAQRIVEGTTSVLEEALFVEC